MNSKIFQNTRTARAIIIILILTACTPANGSQNRPVASPPVIIEPISVQLTATSTFINQVMKTPIPSLTHTSTATLLTVRTETPLIDSLDWAEGITPLLLLNAHLIRSTGSPLWSPTENSILFDCHLIESTITTISFPENTSEELTVNSGCWSAVWSPSGKTIAFLDNENYLGIINLENREIARLSKRPLRLPVQITWLELDRLVYSHYSGGNHSAYFEVNTLIGEETDIAVIPGGEYGPPNADFLPITAESGINERKLFVVSSHFPANNTGRSNGYYTAFPTYRSIPADQAWTAFKGWLTDPDRILVAWKHYLPTGEVLKENLLLWNIRTDRVEVVGPNGIDGIFSPDARYLAYQTWGPIQRNGANQPIDYDSPFTVNLYDRPPEVPTYVQLLDVVSREVIFAMPAEIMNFSPDNQFLALLSKSVEEENRGVDTVTIEKDQSEFLHLYDLRSGKIVISLEKAASLPVWSPDHNRFIYLDGEGRLLIYHLSSGQSTVIGTVSSEEVVSEITWSFDGQFFLIRYAANHNGMVFDRIAVVKTP
jgi:hypothetical protein